MLAEEAKGFGCPYEDFNEDFFSQILREYAISLVTMTVAHYPHVITSGSSSALSLLTQPQTNAAAFWCPELAHNLAALKSENSIAAERGIGQILLNLSCSGVPGLWGITLEQPSWFHWDKFLLPEAQTLAVESNGRTALVKLGNGNGSRVIRFEAVEGTREWSNDETEVIPHINTGDSSILLITDAVLKQFDLPQPDFPVLKEIGKAQLDSVNECLNLLRQRFPACSVWIERVLRYLCLVQSPLNAMHSGSFEGYFGFVFMTDRPDPVKSAEMMIHECSHQYISILTRFTALTADDGRLYYSPFVRKDRPADRILLAYHAFANVESFYKDCIRAGIRVSHSKGQIEQLRPDLDFVERALVSDINFTAYGRRVMDSLLANRGKV
jgi:hypothetical protein